MRCQRKKFINFCVSNAYMDIETLKLIIHEQKDDVESRFRKENIIERDIEKLFDLNKTKQVLTITGIRRCGKSTLAHLFLKKYKYAYINFDDERIESIKISDMNKILEAFYQLYGNIDFIIFDEIQNVLKWELFITRLQQSKKIIITGSNSRLLSSELSTRLTGRHIDIILSPFSFREFLRFRGLNYDIYLTADIAKIKNYLNEYLIRGGFPEGDDKYHVKSIYDDIITKDILLRHNIKFRSVFKEFARLAVSSFSNEITYSNFKDILNVKSVHTIRNYLDVLEEVFLVFKLPKFSFKFKQQIREPKKLYVVDNGIIDMLGFKFRENIGRIYENTVFLELKRRQSLNNMTELFYYKTSQGHEVDFVVKRGVNVQHLIQVCYNIKDENVKKREIRSLIQSSKDLRCKSLIIITGDYEAEEEISWFGIERKIKFIPLWKWMLTDL